MLCLISGKSVFCPKGSPGKFFQLHSIPANDSRHRLLGHRCYSRVTGYFSRLFALDGKVESNQYSCLHQLMLQNHQYLENFYNDYQQKSVGPGVSDLPLFVGMFMAKPRISFVNKLLRIIRVVKTIFSGLLIGL